MITNLLYILPAILGLSILIFFHELGHYFMARRVGMRVETFAIGFGRPIYSWERDGVKWQIGWLLFGGYVNIAGQDPDEKRDPYTIPDSFFGKKPIDRIKVALAGPVVNIILAFLIFVAIWALGGREKNFSEFTHKIGWVDPHSKLYADGIRPGDEISSYNHAPYQSFKDHVYVPMTTSGDIDVSGLKINYATGAKQPFEYKITPYPHPQSLTSDRLTTGIISSANYIIYDKMQDGQDNPLPEGSPMKDSGIQYGDRIVWVDGNPIFSVQQMSHILNDGRVLLTIERDGKTLLARVPRVPVQELKLDTETKEELTDWQYEAGLNSTKFQKLYTIPYQLTNECVVEGDLKFIDKDNELEAFPQYLYSTNELPLQVKDKIIAIDGIPVKVSFELLNHLQQHEVNIIVERNTQSVHNISWKDSDLDFDQNTNYNEIDKIANSIGTDKAIKTLGNYRLLNAFTPKTRHDFEISTEKKALVDAELAEQKKELEGIEDSEKKSHALALFKLQENQLVLGIPVQDERVNYNPSPIIQFKAVFSEIWDTLSALLTGALNPKWISGPIGIVQVVHDNWMVGIKEALFWLGAISLNLGMLNLLPIPVLDGGTILISLVELITGKRLSIKTMEKLILPFAILLITFFIFLTYQDLSRLFHFMR